MKEITVQNILNLIKQMRIEKGLSQAQAAKLANISTSFYGMIERGNRTLSIEQFISIVKIFDCSISDFLEILEDL
jgi:DNA-binding XRE family transcriptional regulator